MEEIDSRYTRVTEILSHLSGLSNIPQHILDKACERGTVVHSVCDAIIEGMGIPEYEEEYSGYIESFKKWYGDKEFIQKPDRLYCDRFMITGEVDAIYKEGNIYTLVDFKTPVKESKTWSLQMSAYVHLLKQIGIDIHQIKVVQLLKNGEYPTIYTYENEFDKFIYAYLDYLIRKRGEESPPQT